MPHHENLVGLGRLELPTSPLSGVRSNQLSYRPGLLTVTNTVKSAGFLPTDLTFCVTAKIAIINSYRLLY